MVAPASISFVRASPCPRDTARPTAPRLSQSQNCTPIHTRDYGRSVRAVMCAGPRGAPRQRPMALRRSALDTLGCRSETGALPRSAGHIVRAKAGRAAIDDSGCARGWRAICTPGMRRRSPQRACRPIPGRSRSTPSQQPIRPASSPPIPRAAWRATPSVLPAKPIPPAPRLSQSQKRTIEGPGRSATNLLLSADAEI